MAQTQGISFLYEFDFGNRNVDDPLKNILFTTSTAEGDFSPANLTSECTREKWRSTGVTVAQEIIYKAEVKSEVDTIAILNHNLTSDAVVLIQANISNNFLAPPVNIYVPWSKNNLFWLTSLGETYEYYKFTFLDPTNPCGYIEIGKIMGGRAFTLTNNEDIRDDFTIGKKDLADKMETEGFFRQSNERVKIRSLSASLAKLETRSGLANENFLGLREMFDYVGETVPLLCIVDRNNPEVFSAWGQFNSIPSEVFNVNQYMTSSLKFTEVF